MTKHKRKKIPKIPKTEVDTTIISDNDTKKIDIKYVFECITLIIGIISVVGLAVLTYIDFCGNMHFEFNIDYYEPKFSNLILFVLVLIICGGIVSLLLALLVVKGVDYFYKKLKNKSCRNKAIIEVILAAISLIALLLFVPFLISNDEYRTMIALLVFGFEVAIYCLIKGLYRFNRYLVAIVVVVSMILALAIALGFSSYQNSENKTIFRIIDDYPKKYVIISEGHERYSAFECEISECGDLTIVIDEHKYFNISDNDEVSLVRFRSVKRKEKGYITAEEYINSKTS